MPANFTSEIITAAIEGFEPQKRRIDDQITELRALLPGGSAESTAGLPFARTEAPEIFGCCNSADEGSPTTKVGNGPG